MKINPSKLRDWNNEFEFNVKYNISDCSTYPLTTEELLSIANEKTKANYQKINLGYTKSDGDENLRKIIAKQYKNLSSKNIFITNGAIEAIYLIMNSLFNSGDEIIVGWPCYQALYEVASAAGLKINKWILRQTKDCYYFDFSELSKMINKKTVAIVINQPQVPTGFIFKQEEYKKLIEIARNADLLVIADEVCRWLNPCSVYQAAPVVDVYEKGISIGDFSKPFGAGGLRIGWLATCDPTIFKKISPLRGYTTMSNSATSEFLAKEILNNKEKILIPRLKTAKKNINTLKKFTNEFTDKISFIQPNGGVTALVNYNAHIDDETFCRDLIKKENIMLVPGSLYGWKNCFRIGFGAKEDIFTAGLAGLRKYLKYIK